MTLTLIFRGVKYPGIDPGILPGGDSTIQVTGAPDEDPALAERMARAVLTAGVGPVPRMGRVSWDELVNAGLEAGILARAPVTVSPHGPP